jgi:Conjugative transposon protein TcpC
MAAEGFACLFARRYLTWKAQDPDAYRRALAPFVGSQVGTDVGLRLPPNGEQQVQWVEVVQDRVPAEGEHVYTVATQTDSAGLLYLTVSVLRGADGSLELVGYPAIVGAPAAKAVPLSETDPIAGAHLPSVNDPGLLAVVSRALRNYLAEDVSDLAADLTGSARVSLPGLKLVIDTVQAVRWLPGGGSVGVTISAEDKRGTQYTLDYELDVAATDGRWSVSAIQMDPSAK